MPMKYINGLIKWYADPTPPSAEERGMLRTGKDYNEARGDGREVWIGGERVPDVATHPAFAPIVNVRARIYDLGHEAGTADMLTYLDQQTAGRGVTPSRAAAAPARTGGKSGGRSTRSWTRRAAWSPGWVTRRSARCGRYSTGRTC